MDKKISLEHAIRNIFGESIGGPNTDKFKGTPKAFLQPAPHIEPKVGDSHPDGSSATAKRGLAKIKNSETMNEAKKVPKNADELLKAIEKEADKLKDIIFEPSTSKGELVPVEKSNPPSVKNDTTTTEPETPTVKKEPVVTEPTTKGDLAPTTKIKTDVEPEIKTKTDLSVKTAPKTDIETKTKTDLGVKTAPKTDVEAKTKSVTIPKVRTQTQTQTKLPEPPPVKPNSPGKVRIPRIGGINFPNIDPAVISGLQGYVPFTPYLHFAKDRATFGEATDADAIRRSIENVARPNSKNKLAKQAEIKAKIIDENAKNVSIIKRVINDKKSTVNLNPKLKHENIDEGVRRMAPWIAAGAAGGATGAAATDAIQNSSFTKTLNKFNPLYDPEFAKQPRGWDEVGADVASMVPFAGTAASSYNAYKDLKRGDYFNAALDTASAVPGVGTITKGAKYGLKGLQYAGKAINKAADLGNIYQLGQTAKEFFTPSSAEASPVNKNTQSSDQSGKSDMPTDVAKKLSTSQNVNKQKNDNWFIQDAKGKTYPFPNSKNKN